LALDSHDWNWKRISMNLYYYPMNVICLICKM
jgi:hypothetical protein